MFYYINIIIDIIYYFNRYFFFKYLYYINIFIAIIDHLFNHLLFYQSTSAAS